MSNYNCDEEKKRMKFIQEHTGRCCDCRHSIPHKSIANRYPLACTSFKKTGITIPHSPDEVVYCTDFEVKK